MKHLKAIFILALILNLSIQPFVSAGTMRYLPGQDGRPGTLNGEAGRALGLDSLGKTQVSITSNVVDILSQVDLTQKETGDAVLRGTAFGAKQETSRRKSRITGFVFFDKGTHLSKIARPSVSDRVTLNSGRVIIGSIDTVNNSEIVVRKDTGSESVNVLEITDVSSPQVYKFDLPIKGTNTTATGDAVTSQAVTGETASIKFICTYKASESAKQASEKQNRTSKQLSRAQKLLIVTVGLAIIATAIAVPIAVPLATSRRGNLSDQQQQLANFLYLRSLTQPAAPPVEVIP